MAVSLPLCCFGKTILPNTQMFCTYFERMQCSIRLFSKVRLALNANIRIYLLTYLLTYLESVESESTVWSYLSSTSSQHSFLSCCHSCLSTFIFLYWKSTTALSAMPHLVSGINFLRTSPTCWWWVSVTVMSCYLHQFIISIIITTFAMYHSFSLPLNVPFP